MSNESIRWEQRYCGDNVQFDTLHTVRLSHPHKHLQILITHNSLLITPVFRRECKAQLQII
jgi:hypothetical protein